MLLALTMWCVLTVAHHQGFWDLLPPPSLRLQILYSRKNIIIPYFSNWTFYSPSRSFLIPKCYMGKRFCCPVDLPSAFHFLQLLASQ